MSKENNPKIHLNCSQKVLNHYAAAYGLNQHLATKIATGLGGGMGRMAGTCGAVSGAYLVLGLEYGPEGMETKAAKELTYSKVRDFHQYFSQKHGSCTCKELLDCDISTSSGFEEAQNQGLMKTRCPIFIDDAINIVEKMIKDDKIAASTHHQSEANNQNGT